MAAAFTALRVLLGLFFVLTGCAKLSEQLLADLQRHMQSEFVRFAEVFPLKEFGFVPEPGRYQQVVGWVEVVAGLLLAFGPQLLQEISNFVLSVIMIGAIYTLLALREPLAMCAPATLCLGLLLLLNIRGYADPPK
ncbi:TM35B protein, partial [Nyctibius bracteatus]|nr:TM35B protein [Nyctibius bracteatus]